MAGAVGAWGGGERYGRGTADVPEILESVDAAIWELDVETFAFTYVSHGVERLLGHPRPRWLEEPAFWQEHLHPDDRRATIAARVAAARSGTDHELEYRMLAANG